MIYSDFIYNTTISKAFIGIVQVKIDSIQFIKEIRQLDPKIIQYLTEVFSGLSNPLEVTRCRPNHQIKAIVTPKELDELLQASQISEEALQKSRASVHYPELSLFGRKLLCLHGQHRLHAAKNILPPDNWWWAVQLYCFELNSKAKTSSS